MFIVVSTPIFRTFCASTMLLVGSSFLVCKVCVRCHVNIIFSTFFVCNVRCRVNVNLQRFLRIHRACWFCKVCVMSTSSSAFFAMFVVMSTSIFSAFCASTMLLVGSSFLVCKVCVRCHVDIDLQRFLCIHHAACWFFIPHLQSVCSLSCQLSLSSLR